MEIITGNISTGSKKLDIALNIASNDLTVNLKPNTTELQSDLDTDRMELNASLTSTPIQLSAELGSVHSSGIIDVRVDDTSIVRNQVAFLTLGDGLAFRNGALQLDINKGEKIVPKGLSIARQEELTLIINDKGVTKHTTVNDLDYSKMTVQETEDLTNVRINDFIFVKED